MAAPGAFDAYKACIESSRRFLHFEVDTSSIGPDDFEITVTYNEPGLDRKATLEAHPSANVTCAWSNTKTANTVLMPTSSPQALLSCHRTARSQSYVRIIRTDGIDNVTLPWQAYTDQGFPQNQMQSLQDEVNHLQQEVAALEALAGNVRHIEIGSIDINQQPPAQYTVTFGRSFKSNPTVITSITRFFESGGPNFEMGIQAENIRTDGFTLNATGHKLYLGPVYWIAVE